MKKYLLIICTLSFSCQSTINLNSQCDCFQTILNMTNEIYSEEDRATENMWGSNLMIASYLATEKLVNKIGWESLVNKCWSGKAPGKTNVFPKSIVLSEKEKVRIGRRIVNDLSEFCSDENQEKFKSIMESFKKENEDLMKDKSKQ